MQPENKTAWFDNLRVLATIGVIFIHVSSDYSFVTTKLSAYYFWIGNIFDAASRFSVPVFVMLSGALMLPKEYAISVFLKKRLVRLVYPFLFWSIIYIVYSFFTEVENPAGMGFWDIARYVFLQLRDGSSYHFWYIYMIIGVYLFIPVIGKYVRNSTEKEMRYFLIIWLCTLILDQPVISKIKPDLELSYFSGYLGYLVLGYYLTVTTFHNAKRTNAISILFVVVGVLATILGTFLEDLYANKYLSTFYENLTPNIMLFATGLFVLNKNKDIRNKALVWVRNFICKYSYGIFLVHVFVLYILNDFSLRWDFIDPMIGIPLTSLLCLVISAGIVFVVNKLPYGKYISG